MDLILWRHADAEDGSPDLARKLTKKGHKQAARVAQWLLERLPKDFELIASPAVRAQETAEALGARIRTVERLAPGASVEAIVKAAGWPAAGGTVIVVGHQPDLGRALAYLVSGQASEWRLPKAGAWWLESGHPTLVKAVVSADLL
ncbi:MAG TPA: histidine phosphatase family protein [Burkholderiales bacterium]